MESLGMRVKPLMNKHILPLFHSINTPYAEVCLIFRRLDLPVIVLDI